MSVKLGALNDLRPVLTTCETREVSTMKRLFVFSVLLLTLLGCDNGGEEDLVLREGLYYKKSSQVPFTGKTMGNPQTTFRHGKMHGPYVEYDF